MRQHHFWENADRSPYLGWDKWGGNTFEAYFKLSMRQENADKGHIWHEINEAAAHLRLNSSSVWGRKTLTGVRIWDKINEAASLLKLIWSSVWGRKTLTGVHIWNEINKAVTLFKLISKSAWVRKTLTGVRTWDEINEATHFWGLFQTQYEAGKR